MTTRAKKRPFPKRNLEDVLSLAQKIQDEMAGRPMNRLLLAEALNIKPASSNYKLLISSSHQYGITTGGEKAESISLTERGTRATNAADEAVRRQAII
jgi:hypothetical protein